MLEVENKNRELSNAALNLIRKNEVLQRLKDDLDARQEPRAMQKILRLSTSTSKAITTGNYSRNRSTACTTTFSSASCTIFSTSLPGDMRLAAYLKMNLPPRKSRRC